MDSTTDRLENLCQSLIPEGESLTTVSAVRCLNVYLERLGSLQVPSSHLQATIVAAFETGDFVSVHASMLAAVTYQAHKEQQGVLPHWPTALAELTGWDGGSSESEPEYTEALQMMRSFLREQ